jgi:hypothetical protein
MATYEMGLRTVVAPLPPFSVRAVMTLLSQLKPIMNRFFNFSIPTVLPATLPHKPTANVFDPQ